MKPIIFVYKLFSILSLSFFVGLYGSYAIISIIGATNSNLEFFSKLSGGLLGLSFFCWIAAVILGIFLLIRRSRPNLFYVGILVLSLLLWLIVMYVDPWGIFDWMFD